MSKEFISQITESGYRAAVGNSPAANGFRVELAHADVYQNGVKKGRFALTGTPIGGKQVRVRAAVTTQTEEYFYDEVRLIDGVSNSDFAVIRREDGSDIDFVSPFKTSFFQCDVTFATLNDNVVTVISASDEINALWAELDTRGAVKWSSLTGVPDATTGQKGIVQLAAAVSEETNKAITPKGVKDALDKMGEKVNALENRTYSYNDLTDKPAAPSIRKDTHFGRIAASNPAHSGTYVSYAGVDVTFPDGRRVQTYHLKDVKDIYFAVDSRPVGLSDEGYNANESGMEDALIDIRLSSPMPNMILSVTATPMRAANASTSTNYYREASEQQAAWALRESGGDNVSDGRVRDRVKINLARTKGGKHENFDLYVVVEGF